MGEFPHTQSKDALIHVTSLFEKGLVRLSALDHDTDPQAIHALCAAELSTVFNLFPLLGFFERSTSVRNPFELHGPLLRIVKQILGEDSELIISSEWEYSPFTFLYPEQFKLTNTVMIGVPCSESENILSVPLAGHELGHNIWRHLKLSDKFGPLVESEIKKQIRDNFWVEFNKFATLGKPEDLDDLLGRESWSHAWQWSLRQCEELFCDFIGIAIFREAFLHSFSYLLAPGFGNARSEYYPAEKDRARYQVQAADSMGVSSSPNYVNSFEDSILPRDEHAKVLLKVADAATQEMCSQLIPDAEKVVADTNIASPTRRELERILKCFALGIPPQNSPGLSAIVIAAWEFYLLDMNAWRKSYPKVFDETAKPLKMLSDLAFKAIEVFEIESRQAGVK